MKKNLAKECYDTLYYDDIIEYTVEYSESYQHKIKHLFDFIGYEFQQGSLALDAGCGAGGLTKYLLLHGQRVVGVDAFEYPLMQARALVPEASFYLADLNRPLPFRDEVFDLIVAYEVMEHLNKPLFFACEAWRVLRPGGQLIIKTPNAWDLWRILDPLLGRTWYADIDKTHVGYFNFLSMKCLLHKAGFDMITVRCGTKPFFRRPIHFNPRLPIIGNGVAARVVKKLDI